MKFKPTILVTSLVLVVVAFFLLATSGFAQSNGLGITPKLSYTVNKGSQQSDTLYVNNLSTSQPLNLRLDVVDFQPKDESGAPKLLRANNSPHTAWSLKPYITLPESVIIEPAKSRLIPFTIKLPANIGAGSYYSAVVYTAVSGSDQEKVNVAASSASLVFVNVPGKASEMLTMTQFGPYQDGKFKSVFNSKPPSTFAYRVKNNGNVNESPGGSIVIKNIFGHAVASIDKANPRSELVLLGQTRRFEVCYPKDTKESSLVKKDNCQALKIKPGLYTAELELLYGQNGQQSKQISAKSTFLYLPLWFAVVVVLVLAALIYGIYKVYKLITAPRHRRKNKK